MYYLRPSKALTTNCVNPKYVESLLGNTTEGLVYGSAHPQILALSGFSREDAPAVNLLVLLYYYVTKGLVKLPEMALAPILNKNAFLGRGLSPLDKEVNLYYDFLHLRSPVSKIVTSFYNRTKPKVVASFIGGEKFAIYATTDEASEILGVGKIEPDPMTPHGIATYKYSHGLEITVPRKPREFELYIRRIAQVFNKAMELKQPERAPVRVAYRDILVLHGGVKDGDEVVIDNDVFKFV